MVLISCFVVFSHVQFGTQITSYNSYQNAFMYNLGMMLGSHHELKEMLLYSYFWSGIYIFVFTFILAFIITNMFQIFVKNEYKTMKANKHMRKVEGLARFYILCGNLSVSLTTTYLGYWWILKDQAKLQLSSPVLPTILFFVASTFVSSLFMYIYGVSNETLLFCVAIDDQVASYTGSYENMLARCPPPLKKLAQKG